MDEPTAASVTRAMEHGANHVLALPADELTLLRILNLVRE